MSAIQHLTNDGVRNHVPDLFPDTRNLAELISRENFSSALAVSNSLVRRAVMAGSGSTVLTV